MRRGLRFAAFSFVALLLGISLLGITYEPSTTIPAGLAGEHLGVAGIDLRMLQEGSGPDVLLIHGSPGALAMR